MKIYLEMELKRVRAEIYNILSKYNIKSFNELDEKINKGELSETDAFDDFTKLDYLEALKEKLENYLVH